MVRAEAEKIKKILEEKEKKKLAIEEQKKE
jgi:hypothetical protein